MKVTITQLINNIAIETCVEGAQQEVAETLLFLQLTHGEIQYEQFIKGLNTVRQENKAVPKSDPREIGAALAKKIKECIEEQKLPGGLLA